MAGFKRLLSSAAIYTVGNVVNAALPFLLLPVLTRVLSPSEYGMVVMFVTTLSVISTITGLSIHGAVSVHYYSKDIDLPRFIGVCMIILLGSTAVTFCLLVQFSPVLARLIPVPTFWILFAVLVSALQFATQIRLVMWQVLGKAFRYGAFQIGQTLLNLVLSLALVLAWHQGWEGRAYGIAVSMALFGCFALLSLYRDASIRWDWDIAYAKLALRFGIPLIPHAIGGVMIATSDRFIVTSLLGVNETGVYAVAMQIGAVIILLADAGNKALAPWLFQHLSRGDVIGNLRIIRITYLLFLLIPICALILGLCAPWLLGVLVGRDFQGSAGAVFYTALGSAFGGMYYLVTNYIFFSGKNERLAAVTFMSGGLGIALSWYLVQKNGVIGAAQAYLLAQATSFFLTWLIAAKCHSMPWHPKHHLFRPEN